MNALDVLVKARTLITPRSHWTRRAMARKKDSSNIEPRSKDAVRWCSLGAIQKVCTAGLPKIEAENRLIRSMSDAVDHFNDTHSHAEVLAAFDAAIEAERAAL